VCWRGRLLTRAQAAGALDVVLPPGQRGVGAHAHNDFAKAGLRMPPEHVAEARRQWRTFMAAAPPYPARALPGGAPLFAGRGIVIGGCACSSSGARLRHPSLQHAHAY
jgi:hypothetical protein